MAGDPVNLLDPTGLDWIDSSLKVGSDFWSGFGDTLTAIPFTGTSLTRMARSLADWDSVVDPCSAAFSAGRYAGIAHGVATGLAASLNGGARTVFFSGPGSYEAAVAGKGGGLMILDTVGGRVLNAVNAPKMIWKGASAIFAANAKGAAQVFLREPVSSSAVWQVEKAVVSALGNATLVFK